MFIMEDDMKVQKKNLLILAGIVWSIAGFNILKIGIEAYVSYVSLLNLVLSLVIYIIFMKFVFYDGNKRIPFSLFQADKP